VIQTRSHSLPKIVELGALFKHFPEERGEGEKTNTLLMKRRKRSSLACGGPPSYCVAELKIASLG
jgi:hypothetical protein